MAHGLPYYRLRYPSHLPIPRGVLPPRLVPCLGRAFRSRLPPPTRVPTFLSHRSTGISTCRPSATAPALALGPDSPRADQLYPGDLGYSAIRILTLFSLLFRHSLLRALHGSFRYRFAAHAMLLYQRYPRSRASVVRFSPGHFRRGTSRPVSYYALFEWVAASEPTSWLSWRFHILFHLTYTLGPWLRVWAVSLSTTQLISCRLTPGHRHHGIRSLIFFGRL